ncbi:MFS transporter [Halopseudomonas oceani]|uniref:MFS transporter n=1 Tax=Halopseudomonas oceani TaxID=1708783 RepID=A0A2P4EYZ6_9GAMM|nr:MFS transporter [Halopseudomonas oceani]POB05708.1 MFS transporter [Halopseudomonas oceani]GGE41562.1 MFS transporter [Halopseudomonas oceani]
MKSSPNLLLGQVSTAHLVSHLHIMALPALLPLLPDTMQVGFVELGFAIGLFNIVSALVQVPLGYLVDRLGARRMLMAALLLGTFSFGLVAVFPSYPCLLVAMTLAGLANGVYHPADYSLLSRGLPIDKMGRAFSIHTFAGFLGGALAPPVMVGVALLLAPRWSFAVAALAGLAAWGVMVSSTPTTNHHPDAIAGGSHNAGTRPVSTSVMTLAVLTLLFTLLSLSTGAIEKFSVSALVQGFDVTLPAANLALTVFLFASAFGVLAGGVLADRTSRHGYVAAGAFALAALIVVLIIQVALPPIALTIALGAAGFLTGMVAPSRDMLVRAASPAGAEGKTFGIVSTGFNLGGVIGPILFGLLLDRGLATGVLWAAVGFMLTTTAVVLLQERHQRSSGLSNG